MAKQKEPESLQRPPVPPLTGKRAIVTGGSTGIGREVVRVLLGEGVRVLTFARHKETLKAALEEFRSLGGGDVHGLTADQANMKDIRKVFAEADKRLGGVDLLVANAADTSKGHAQESDADDPLELENLEYVVRANLAGYVACSVEAARRMKANGGGHIVHIGSMSAEERESGMMPYAATKAGIQAYSESLRRAVNADGIRVSLIEPGLVATELGDKTSGQRRRKNPRLKILDPRDIAQAVQFCLSRPPHADVVMMQVRPTGQLI